MSSLHPWRTESERLIHQDRWLDLRARRSLNEGGEAIDPCYVISSRDWVIVLACTAQDELILVLQ